MKWIRWLVKWAAGAMLASVLSVLTTFYMVESYMDALLDRWNLGNVETPDLDLGHLFSLGNMPDARRSASGGETASESGDETDVLRETGHDRVPGGALKVDAVPAPGGQSRNAGISGGRANQGDAAGSLAERTGIGSGGSEGASEGNGSPASGSAGTGVTTDTPGTGGSSGARGNKETQTGAPGSESGAKIGHEPGPDALPVFGRAALQGGLVMSAEEFNEKRKNLSEADKVEIFTILLNHVPQEELQRLSGLVEDGITADEAMEITDMMEGYLGPAELDRLLAILGGE